MCSCQAHGVDSPCGLKSSAECGQHGSSLGNKMNAIWMWKPPIGLQTPLQRRLSLGRKWVLADVDPLFANTTWTQMYSSLLRPTVWGNQCSSHRLCDCWCNSFSRSNRAAAAPSWITLAGRSLTIGSTIYIVNMTNFLICFQYAEALPFETILFLFLFFLLKRKKPTFINSTSCVSWGNAIPVKDWLWYGGKIHSVPAGHWIHP